MVSSYIYGVAKTIGAWACLGFGVSLLALTIYLLVGVYNGTREGRIDVYFVIFVASSMMMAYAGAGYVYKVTADIPTGVPIGLGVLILIFAMFMGFVGYEARAVLKKELVKELAKEEKGDV